MKSGIIRYSLFFLLVLSLVPLRGQTEIGNVINVYTRIEQAFGLNNLNNDSLLVTSVAGFSAGDTVMIYQVKGADIDIDPGDDGKIGNNRYNTGKYAIMKIDSIQVANRLIFLNTTLPEITKYFPSEMGQLIRVPSYRRAKVISTLTAPAWDPTSGTGGVVAIYVERSLELQADIDVSAKGFKGADMGSEAYTGNCSSSDVVGYGHGFFPETSTDSAGLKGEGIADSAFSLLKGRGRNINGGGGGNARYSGGGGGGNYRPGGSGGDESYALCSPGAITNGMGGYELSAFYTNSGLYANRIFFGGGGGTGTQNPGSGRTATPGGDGGGIVVIVADSIIGNNFAIKANGEGVLTSATAGAGGGGGGGVIVMDVSTVNNLGVYAHGGKGGNTNFATDTTGPGGGGGGGVYWLSGFFKPGLFIDDTTAGRPGVYVPRNKSFNATEGGKPSVLWDLRLPLRGFLFNTVPEGFTVCSDVIPAPVIGSEPKGGNGPGTYVYSWLSRTNSTSWALVPGATSRDFTFTAPLTDTLHLRRIVESGVSLKDTSSEIIINVHPAITGNLIGEHDTVCYGNEPLPLIPKVTLGGGPYSGVPASYSYIWLQSTDGVTWNTAQGTATSEGYAPPGLTASTKYSRVVLAGVCDDTSNLAEITVLPSLTGNSITPDQVICQNDTPELLDGPVPGGGLTSDRRYLWQSSSVANGVYSDLTTTLNYAPPALTDSVYYRRIVFSGLQDECIDTSNVLAVIVLSLISNNTIGSSDSVCAGTDVTGIFGSDPGGGDFNYRHLWQTSTDMLSWDSVVQYNSNQLFDPGVLTDTTYIRRIVKSGLNDVCTNTSLPIEISVLPVIVNNMVTTADVLLCEGSYFPLLDATEPDGGNGTFQYRWEQSEGDSLSWAAADYGISTNEDYDPGQRVITSYFRRIVWSGLNGICRDTTFAWTGEMQNAISNNEIDSYLQYTCYNTAPDLLNGTPASGITGGDETAYSFKWEERSESGTYGIPAQTADGEDYQAEALKEARYYRRIVTSGVCADTTQELSLLIHMLPRADLVSYEDTICEGSSPTLTLTLSGEPGWNLSYADGVTGNTQINGILTSPYAFSVTPETDDSLTYLYIPVGLTDGFGCAAPEDSLFGVVSLRVYQTPVAEILDRDVSVCDTVITLPTRADNGTGTWEVLSGPATLLIDDVHAENGVLRINNTPSAYGTYNVQWTRVAPRCPGEPDNTSVTFFEEPDPAYAGEDLTIFTTNQAMLNASPATAGLGWWTVISGPAVLADSLDPGSSVTDISLEEDNIFRWNIRNGVCPYTFDDITLIRMDKLLYNGFSPNNDQVNDFFVIRGMRYADDFELNIYNSWGTHVRKIVKADIDVNDLITQGEAEDELKLWDGTTPNGNLVPDGTYYYSIWFEKNGKVYEDADYVIVKTR